MTALFFSKKKLWLILLLVMLFPGFDTTGQKPRLLVTTDIGGDPDDTQSLIRLMVYANEFEIEGLISSASGTPGELEEAIIRPDLIEKIVRTYEQVYPNLLKHDPAYPDPSRLLTVIKKGNPNRGLAFIGEGHDTEASDWIIRQVDKKDKRPLNISIFGGQTDLAQALWKVKNSRPVKEYRKFISKIRIYDINDQDKIFSFIAAKHPGLFYILAKAAPGADRRQGVYRGIYLGGDESLTSLDWLKANVVENHGALGALYPLKTWTDPNPHGVMKEGDTPSWFFFLRNGLNCPDHPELGGWGGRFRKDESGIYRDYPDSPDGNGDARISVSRWRPEFQNDWASRMDWCVKVPAAVNHSPVVVVNNHRGKELLVIKGKAGKKINFDASATVDPDGDDLHFEWLIYPELPDNTNTILTIDRHRATVSAESKGKEKQVSVLLKVTDNGKPALTSYKRILVELP